MNGIWLSNLPEFSICKSYIGLQPMIIFIMGYSADCFFTITQFIIWSENSEKKNHTFTEL